MNKEVFIDAGSNIGQAFESFKTQERFGLDRCDYYLIEPNIDCIKQLKNKYGNITNLIILHKALHVSNSTANLLTWRARQYDVGCSIIQDHNTISGKKGVPIQITETMDVSGFLTELNKKYDKIYMKLDIECSEFDVLEKMIDDGTYKFVSEIWCEFHDQYMTTKPRMHYGQRRIKIQQFFAEQNININYWA